MKIIQMLQMIYKNVFMKAQVIRKLCVINKTFQVKHFNQNLLDIIAYGHFRVRVMGT